MGEEFTGKKVLVADDQQNFRDAVAFEFELLGFETVLAENGKDAHDKFEQSEFDLVVSDIRMPVWDGPRFLEEVRKSAKTHPPFVFMTGFTDLKEYDAFARGADLLLGKPLDPDRLKASVMQLLAPIEERWSRKPDGDVNHRVALENVSIKSGELQLGRGGIFIPMTLLDDVENYRNGDLIELQLSLSSGPVKKIDGICEVSWVRHTSDKDLSEGCGLRFIYFEEPCRPELVRHISTLDDISSIPRGELFESSEAAVG